MNIPSRVEELTPAWLSEVLRVEVRSVAILDAHSGTTGRARIAITADADVPDTLFVKLQPFVPEQRDFLRVIGIGVSEARLYAAVGDDLPVRVPRTWHSSFDDAEGAFIMVLEDLEASGCRFPAFGDDDVLDIATSLVDELAKLHAAFWGEELPWLGTHALSPAEGEEKETQMAMGAAIVQSAIDQFAGDMRPVFRELAELYVARYRDIDALWNQGEKTLVHGDDHLANLFVDHGRTGLFDWAVASRWPGVRDVAYFLTNSLPTADRRSEQDALLRRYRSALAGQGVTLEDRIVEEQYRLFAIYGWIAATTTAAMGDQLQPIEISRPAMERATDAIADLDVVGLLHEHLR